MSQVVPHIPHVGTSPIGDIELPPRLKVDGAILRKPNGNQFHPVGLSWGSWGKNYIGDAEANQAMHANVIRDLLRVWGLYGSPEIDALDWDAATFFKRTHLAQFFQELDWIVGTGMWAAPALDSNCAQSGTQTPEMRVHCDKYAMFGAAGRNIYTDKPMRRVFISMWQSLARALRLKPGIAWYEIHPEPLPGCGPEWAPLLREVHLEVIDGIREVDQDTPIMIGPRDAYNTDYLEEVYIPGRKDILYTGNVLSGKLTNPAKLKAAIDAMVAFRDRHDVPVWFNQFGRKTGKDRDLAHMRSALQQANDARIGYAWWQHAQNSTDPNEYALRYPDGQGGWIVKQNEIDCLAGYLQAARQATPSA